MKEMTLFTVGRSQASPASLQLPEIRCSTLWIISGFENVQFCRSLNWSEKKLREEVGHFDT